MTQNENIKEAIKELTSTGSQLVKPQIENIPFTTTSGDTKTVPVAFVADGPGKVRAWSLLDVVQAAQSNDEVKRLAVALGPDRRKGTATHHTLGSFLAHVDRFKDGGTAIWINREAEDADGEDVTQLVAIFNYHQPTASGSPRWGDHTATYDIRTSPAWEEWNGGQPMDLSADSLAEFLEAHDYQLAQGTLPSGTTAPPPAFLLTMADKLEVHSSNQVRKERDPKTGRTILSFTEEKGATLGDVAPPSAFLISIPVFTDSKEPVTMEVRMRVTVQDKKAVFKLWIHDAARIFEKEMGKLRDDVVLASGVPVFSGVAE
jgi:uncharacterized protein YfdQ (DUF2303 family)